MKTTKRVKPGTSDAAERKAAFVEHYLQNGGNATQAAISAGYSEKTARQSGSRLLTDVAVSQQIAERKAKIQQKLELTTEGIAAHLAQSLYCDARRLYKSTPDGFQLKELHELDDDLAVIVDDVCVADGKVTFKLPSRDKAADKAMKYRGMYKADTAPSTPLDGVDRELLNAMLKKLASMQGGA